MQGAFNNLCLSVSADASIPEIIRQIDLLLEPYGCLGAYDRSDHNSHRYVRDEMENLKSMATVGPTIFLSVAAFLLNVVLSRMIATQRDEIAALKAFGYTGLDIGLHYLKITAVVVVVGGAANIRVASRRVRPVRALCNCSPCTHRCAGTTWRSTRRTRGATAPRRRSSTCELLL